MPLNLDSALGIHPQALAVRSRKAELLASNMANADTPNYKARDVDFRQALAKAANKDDLPMATSHSSHLGQGSDFDLGDIQYRIPLHPSLDGNTVETQVEKSEFMDNAIRYQASLRFMTGRVKGIVAAIKEE
jgi:flagellar basal-body rod protein FlgB